MPEQATPITFRKATSMPVGRERLLNLIEISLDPFVLVASLWAVAWIVSGTLLPRHFILALVVFSLAGSRYPACSHCLVT